MNPNHHPYGLGGGPNLNLLDNMLMAAGFQATDQPIIPKPSLVPQYTYAQDMAMHQHAMNLVQPHVTTSVPSDPVHVIVYQNEQQQQQQPISYKIPQLGTTVVAQDQFVVNEQAGQINRSNNHSSSSPATATSSRPTNPQLQSVQQPTRHIQSPAERKKDIVAQAMQEQKIFEENNAKLEPAQVKQEPGVVSDPPPTTSINNSVSNNSINNASNSNSSTTAANSTTTTTSTTAGPDVKPVVTDSKPPVTTVASTQQRRPYQRTNYNRQQIMPRLQILEDEDDGLTCRLCLASFWYKSEIHEHLKTTHSIADPDKYDREEKEKKLRRIREEQQRIQLAKKQREERERRLREAKYGKAAVGRGGKSGPGTIRLTSPGARPPQTPGQRPSFQYRDGAFICDLCKESFSDGNDMVTHWKSHVKKQQAEAGKGRGKGPGRGSGIRGRPPKGGRQTRYKEDSDSDGNARKARRLARSGGSVSKSEKGKKGKRGDKGKPRWTAYLLWSTRKRRDVVVDHPDWTFAEIAKWISEEWKKVESDDKDELQKEAEEMNELGIRKLPRDDDGPDLEKETTDEDSDFEEGYRKKQKKPIMLKIKKDAEADAEGGSKKRRRRRKKGSDESQSDQSDWEPELEVLPPSREQTRSGRQRKRPSFFQEFESQENNLDNILEEFEKQQKAEALKPRPPKPEPKEKKPRKPREKKIKVEEVVQEPQEEEVEVLRSGRKRKKTRTTALTSFFASDDEDERGKGASSDDEDFEPPEEPEIEAIEDADDLIEDDDELIDADDDGEDAEGGGDEDGVQPRRKRKKDMELPPKKRGRPKKILTDAEIEEATRQAMDAKPVIEITRVPRPSKEKKDEKDEDTGSGSDVTTKKTARKSMKNSQQENEGFKVRPTWVNEALTDSEDEDGNSKTKKLGVKKEPVEGKDNGDEDDEDEEKGESEKEKDDGADKDSHPVEETPEADDDSGANPLGDDENPLGESNPLDEDEASEKNPLGETDYSESVPMDSNPLDEEPEENGLPDPEEDPFATGASAAEPSQDPVEDPFDAVAGGGSSEGGAAAAGGLDVPMSEEDLLTGPAHNLDDSQYKPDYNDSNFDEIFK